MRMRVSVITVLMATMLAASQGRHLCVTAIGRSAHAFSQYFQALRQEPLNPVERVVFSLVLAKAKAQQECPQGRHG
jgi:hypothetical protein